MGQHFSHAESSQMAQARTPRSSQGSAHLDELIEPESPFKEMEEFLPLPVKSKQKNPTPATPNPKAPISKPIQAPTPGETSLRSKGKAATKKDKRSKRDNDILSDDEEADLLDDDSDVVLTKTSSRVVRDEDDETEYKVVHRASEMKLTKNLELYARQVYMAGLTRRKALIPGRIVFKGTSRKHVLQRDAARKTRRDFKNWKVRIQDKLKRYADEWGEGCDSGGLSGGGSSRRPVQVDWQGL
jgi:hypothetical protein